MKTKKIGDLTIDQLRMIIDEVIKENMGDMLENLEAVSSPKFVRSIERSRKEYKAKKFKDFKEIFST